MSTEQDTIDTGEAADPSEVADEQPAAQAADWESLVVQRIAHHVNAVRQVAGDAEFGWESEGLRRLSREVVRAKLG